METEKGCQKPAVQQKTTDEDDWYRKCANLLDQLRCSATGTAYSTALTRPKEPVYG